MYFFSFFLLWLLEITPCVILDRKRLNAFVKALGAVQLYMTASGSDHVTSVIAVTRQEAAVICDGL